MHCFEDDLKIYSMYYPILLAFVLLIVRIKSVSERDRNL